MVLSARQLLLDEDALCSSAQACIPAALVVMAVGNLLMGTITTASTAPMLGLCVFLMRSAAMGALVPFTNTVLSQWFVRRRGLAISVVEMASMIGTTFVVAQVWEQNLDGIGWRLTHVYSASFCLAMALPVAPANADCAICHPTSHLGRRFNRRGERVLCRSCCPSCRLVQDKSRL